MPDATELGAGLVPRSSKPRATATLLPGPQVSPPCQETHPALGPSPSPGKEGSSQRMNECIILFPCPLHYRHLRSACYHVPSTLSLLSCPTFLFSTLPLYQLSSTLPLHTPRMQLVEAR